MPQRPQPATAMRTGPVFGISPMLPDQAGLGREPGLIAVEPCLQSGQSSGLYFTSGRAASDRGGVGRSDEPPVRSMIDPKPRTVAPVGTTSACSSMTDFPVVIASSISTTRSD